MEADCNDKSEQRIRITGRVLEADGTPLSGKRVRAFRRELTPADLAVPGELLADEASKPDGSFSIGLAETSVDALVVLAFTSGSPDELVSSSPVVFDARGSLVIDLVSETGIHIGKPEVKQIGGAFDPHLEEDADPTAFGEKEIKVLAGKTGMLPTYAAYFVIAYQMANAFLLSEEMAHVLYALFRGGMPTSPALFGKSRDRMRQIIDAAKAAHIIDPAIDTDEAIESIDTVAVTTSLLDHHPTDPAKPSLKKLLSVVLGTDAKREKFVEIFFDHTGSMDSFWETIGEDADLGIHLGELQLVFQLGAVTGNRAWLVDHLMDSVTDLKSLVAKDATWWVGQIGDAGPLEVPVDADALAADIMATIEKVFPTAVIANQIGADASDVSGFLLDEDHGGFDFHTTNVGDYFALNPGSGSDALKDKIAKYQRLFRLVPSRARYSYIKPLLAANFDSASSIVRAGKEKFRNSFASDSPVHVHADEIFDQAVSRATAAAAILARFHPAYRGPSIPVLRAQPTTAPDDFTSYDSFIGGASYCTCEECCSILGPAAYLADIMHFLERRVPVCVGTETTEAADMLALLRQHRVTGDGKIRIRREDLQRIDLSCANANVLLPQIDLVNELLEMDVVYGGDTDIPPDAAYTRQTGGSQEDLAWAPEHSTPEAYTTLRSADNVYPWSLPFDLYRAQEQTYLKTIGIDRVDLIEKLNADQTDDSAAERLGLTSVDVSMLVEPFTPAGAQWGTTAVAWVAEVSALDVFLARSGLTMEEVGDICRSPYINPDVETNAIEIAWGDDPCDISDAVLRFHDGSPLTAAVLGRIYRFVRLRNRTGWTTAELDEALRAFGGTLDLTMIRRLGCIAALLDVVSTPLMEVIHWFKTELSQIDWGGNPSFFAKHFHNGEVHVTPGTTDLYEGSQSVAIFAGLGIDIDEARLLLDNEPRYADMEAIALLFHGVSLARAVGMTVREYVRYRSLIDSSLTEPLFVLRMIRARRAEEDLKFSVGDIAFLTNGATDPAENFMPSDETIATALIATQTRMRSIRSAPIDVPDASEAELWRNLSQLFRPTAIAERVQTLVTGFDVANVVWSSDDISFFTEQCSSFFGADMASVATQLKVTAGTPPTTPTPDPAERRRIVLSYAAPYVELLNAAAAGLAPIAGPQPLLTYLLGGGLRYTISGKSLRALDSLLSVVDLPPAKDFLTIAWDEVTPPNRENEPNQFALIEALRKASMLASKLALIPAEYDLVFLHKVPDFYAVFDPAKQAYSNFAFLRRAVTARATYFGKTQTYFDLIQRAFDDSLYTIEQWAGDLEARMHWPADDVLGLTALFEVTFPAFAQDPDGYGALAGMMSMARKLGMPILALQTHAHAGDGNDVAAARAHAIRGAVRAKHTTDSWPEIGKAITDRLRMRQRDALVSFIMARDGLKSPDELFDRLLIDTQVSSCQKTSRIKAAIGTVQTFVQRALLQLEPGAHLDENDASEWRWMKSYRVWEANRKVFLYPENWLVPELRDNKTALFEAFEHSLRQNDADAETVEDAFIDYAHGLATVAKLSVAAYCDDENGNLYVFGRTLTDPREYYYRSYTETTGWLGWEKLPLKIEGTQLCPYVYNGRLYAFWLDVGEPEADPADPRLKNWRLRLSWSSRRNGKWLNTNVASVLMPAPAIPNPDLLYLRVGEDPNDLIVSILRYAGVASSLFVAQFKIRDGVGPVESDPWYGYLAPSSIVTPAETFPATCGARQAEDGQALVLASVDPVASEPALGIDDDMVLETSPAFDIVFPPRMIHYVGTAPAFYQNADHVYFFRPSNREDIQATIDSLQDVALTDPRIVADAHVQLLSGEITTAPSEPFLTQGDPIYGTAARDAAPMSAISMAGLNTGKYSVGSEAATSFTLAVRLGSDGASKGASGAAIVGVDTAGHVEDLLERSIAEVPSSFARQRLGYRFWTFEHPYAKDVVRALDRKGIAGLFDPAETDGLYHQQAVEESPTAFSAYEPTDLVLTPHPVRSFEFDPSATYATYNWELFFHAPFLVAEKLRANRDYEDSLRWLRFIFDPMDATGGDPERAWKIKPFRDEASPAPITQLMRLLDYTGTNAEAIREREDLELQLRVLRASPFHPHAIARLRTEAYMKATVMKMLDVLIEWGDSLFAVDTIESINEATQLYIIAARILGPRPIPVDHPREGGDKPYHGLSLDEFSNAIVAVENVLRAPETSIAVDGDSGLSHILAGPSYYFCIPTNDKLFGYWDTVADRLFKVRHCQNLGGVVRELPLFEPPIDPALLVRAAAGGDFGDAISDLNAPRPAYRFMTMAQKAMELAGEVRALGASLLSALEKGDAEVLSTMRSGQELDLLQRVRDIKAEQLEEARRAREGLDVSKQLALRREKYYQGLIDGGLVEEEHAQLDGMEAANGLQIVAQVHSTIGSFLAAIPEFDGGAVTPLPLAKARFGGNNLTNIFQGIAGAFQLGSTIASHRATVSGINAGYRRREKEWSFQAELARLEQSQIDKQIASADIRVAMAQNELANHEKQIANAEQVNEFLTSKFTRTDLYDWMISELSLVHNEAYRMAYAQAKKAQKAFEYEIRPSSAPSFVTFGYWDSRKKGLLAGERLAHDLRRMEVAYLDANVREHEMVKHVSLAQVDPVALIKLRSSGACVFTIPEAAFDLDAPGEYFRRIKSVSVTVPCVTGPYSTVGAKLQLAASHIRTKPTLRPDGSDEMYVRDDAAADGRFVDYSGAGESIVTSSAQNDAGLFEANLRDERYLPFEGQGAISEWILELPGNELMRDAPEEGESPTVPAYRQFDYQSISDVVVTIRYTARDGGLELRKAAREALLDALNVATPAPLAAGESAMRMFSMRQEFPDAWHAFVSQPVSGTHSASIKLSPESFPTAVHDKGLQAKSIDFVLVVSDDVKLRSESDPPTVTLSVVRPSTSSGLVDLVVPVEPPRPFGENPKGTLSEISETIDPDANTWTITLDDDGVPPGLQSAGALDATKVVDLVLVVHYALGEE